MVDNALVSNTNTAKRSRGLASMTMMKETNVDVAVLGAGVAGTTISALLADQHNVRVSLNDFSLCIDSWYLIKYFLLSY